MRKIIFYEYMFKKKCNGIFYQVIKNGLMEIAAGIPFRFLNIKECHLVTE